MKRLLLTAMFVAALALVSTARADLVGCSGPVVGPTDVSPPPGSTQVVNAVMGVTNDEDSGNVGYWALDDYLKQIEVWQTPSGSFYAGVLYFGTWRTFAEALSPGAGVTEPSDGLGPFRGGYIATFTGELLATPTKPTFGVAGTFDFGGTKDDIEKGSYANGQTGPTTVVDWTTFYFSSVAGFDLPEWGWEYTYPGQQWCNTSTETTGDIVTAGPLAVLPSAPPTVDRGGPYLP